MIKDDNSHGEGRDLGMDELQFDDIDSMLASESSSEPSGLEDLSIDSLESLVASSGEEYPSSFENDFYFHPEEIDSGSSDPSLEDPMDLELTDPIVDVEIEKLLDIGDFVDSSTSKTSNLESDDSFFNPGDSAPDEGMDFSELDNYLTEESDEIDFGEESDDIEEFALSDHQEKAENISSHEDDFLNEEEPIALSESELEEIVSEPLPDFILNSEEENIALSDSELDGILEGEEFPETDTRFEAPFEESEEDGSIAFSGSELDDILNTTTDESGALTNSEADDDDLPDFITHTDFDENEEPVDSSLSFEPETISFEAEDANEPIALSEDELGNLLSSENEEPVDSSLGFEPEAISFEAEDENEPIALSEDELGNLLSSENEEPVDSSLGFEPETISFEAEDENEPIALSEDELGNLLSEDSGMETSTKTDGFEDLLGDGELPEDTGSMFEENEPFSLPDLGGPDEFGLEEETLSDSSTDFEPNESFMEPGGEDEEAIALSEEELGNLLSSDEKETPSSSLFDETSSQEEDSISLPVRELDAIPSPQEDSLALENFELSTDDFDTLQTQTTTSFEAEDTNEPIALSEDELDHILTDDEEPNVSENTLEKFPGSELDWDSPVSEQTEEDEGPIALSEDELGNLLEDAPATIKEEDLNEILGELPPTSDLDAFDSIDDNVSKEKVPPQVAATEDGLNQDEMIIVLDEYADEEKSSPIEELRKTPDQEEKEDASGTPSKEEMKRIMTYLDELLGNLPDDLIREFSRSDYFELYKKLMKQIGV
ncbi:hypothetical protein LEP1GSC036_0714 [Leptospira weilii str. 2006001853]|uniref:Uncharacterized protein n=1 Tax=Leptospira weilii str. 2006001853 TaxID=1001589 RepID=A0A828Z723_9LEPT|nr:hypothetical protein [Leptospira weilii]EKR66127.1 hypothetical protein LEP1GSC036_0714 [Leptospira weilii str. 2006001853]